MSLYDDFGNSHSFPTRRSSDLVHHRLPIKVVVCNNGLLGQILWEQMALGFPEHGVRYQDRKSTRLNSSHRCTSYAVFCLKKKYKTHTDYLANSPAETIRERGTN